MYEENLNGQFVYSQGMIMVSCASTHFLLFQNITKPTFFNQVFQETGLVYCMGELHVFANICLLSCTRVSICVTQQLQWWSTNPIKQRSPGKRARGRDESESSTQPKKGVDRLWREGELLVQILKREREQGIRHYSLQN